MLGETLEGGRRIDTETGLIMPWYTSPCLEWLLTLDLKFKLIFEYGVGDSTKWYRFKGADVWGVDSNSKWIDIACKKSESNWNYYLFNRLSFFNTTNKESYLQWVSTFEVDEFDYFDIIIIDGDYRDECTEHALKALKPGGYLIIDNFHQASADLEHWPLTDKLIEGMPITIYKEPGHHDWCTAVITKP